MPPRPATTICLNMIVKNEAPTIARSLNSAKPFLTHWTIVDTGSTDGTQAIIRETLKDIPGELHERPWKNFAHNRNEAIELAIGKAEYLLIIDADDELVAQPGFSLPKLTHDAYEIEVKDVGSSYMRLHFFRPESGLRYVGVLHEALTSNLPFRRSRLDGLVYRRHPVGARSRDPAKFEKDAAVLEAALAAEPGNARYAFYLAQSYRDMKAHEKALAAYEKRAAMGGWHEEVYLSLLEIAKLGALLERGDEEVVAAYLRAYEFRPVRVESLCYLAIYLRQHGRVKAGFPFARLAVEMPRPDDLLFIDEAVYSWRSLDEFAIAAYAVGRYADSAGAAAKLLAGAALPKAERARVAKNVELCRAKLGAIHAATPVAKKGAARAERRRK